MNKQTENRNTAEMILQVHLAEYQAITNRCTYWTAIQYALLPVVPVYLVLVAQVWTSMNHELLVWSSGLTVQLIAALWIQCLLEIFNNVRYIETKLKPLVQPHIRTEAFWRYESYLARQRGNGWAVWDYTVIIIDVACLIAISVRYFPHSTFTWLGFAINVAAFLGLALATVSGIKIRREFTKAAIDND